MKDTQNVTIALLCVAATILGTMVVLTYNSSNAQGAGIAAAAGEYIMFTGEVTGSTDLLYVIDLTKRRMNAYHFDPMANVIELKDQVDLGKAFREAAAGK